MSEEVFDGPFDARQFKVLVVLEPRTLYSYSIVGLASLPMGLGVKTFVGSALGADEEEVMTMIRQHYAPEYPDDQHWQVEVKVRPVSRKLLAQALDQMTRTS